MNYNDYVVVYIKSLGINNNGERSSDPYGELITTFFVKDETTGEKFITKWPIGGYKKQENNRKISYSGMFAIPIFAKPISHINDTLDLDFYVADVDTASILPFIDNSVNKEILYDLFSSRFVKTIYGDSARLNSGNRMRDLLKYFFNNYGAYAFVQKNDLIGFNHYRKSVSSLFRSPNKAEDVQNMILNDKKNNYNGGLSVVARKVSVPSNMKIKVKLKKIKIIKDGDSGSNKGDLTLWYRVADGFSKNGFGASFEDTGKQLYGTMNLGEISDGGVLYPDKVVFQTSHLGPFLYLEFNIFDRDSDCINPDRTKYPSLKENFDCYLSTKLDDVGIFTTFLLANDTRLLFNPNSTIKLNILANYLSETGKASSSVLLEITRYPLTS